MGMFLRTANDSQRSSTKRSDQKSARTSNVGRGPSKGIGSPRRVVGQLQHQRVAGVAGEGAIIPELRRYGGGIGVAGFARRIRRRARPRTLRAPLRSPAQSAIPEALWLPSLRKTRW